MIQRQIFLADDGNMVIGTIQRRTHQVGHASIQPHIILVDLFLMQHGCHQIPIRAGNHAAALHGDTQRM